MGVSLDGGNGSIPYGPPGSPVTAVLSVQGMAAGTPLPVAGNFTLAPGTATLGAVTITGTTAVSGAVSLVGTSPVSVVGTSAISGAVAVSSLPPVNGTVSISGTHPVTVTGTSAISGVVSISSQPAPTGTTAIAGTVTVSGTPSVAVAGTATVTGIVLPYTSSDNLISGVSPSITGTQTVLLLPSPGGGLRNYVTSLTVTNAVNTGTVVSLKDGTNGTAIWSGYCGTQTVGCLQVTFPSPLRQPTAGTALNCFNVTGGASVIVSVSGYKGV